jgi:hypothetical protein
MICQQLGGINGVCFYVSNILEQAGNFMATILSFIFLNAN